jgi:hypothetical protein
VRPPPLNGRNLKAVSKNSFDEEAKRLSEVPSHKVNSENLNLPPLNKKAPQFLSPHTRTTQEKFGFVDRGK